MRGASRDSAAPSTPAEEDDTMRPESLGIHNIEDQNLADLSKDKVYEFA